MERNISTKSDDMVNYSKEIHDSYIENIQSMEIEKIVMQAKSSTKHRIADYRTTHDDHVRSIKNFENKHMPKLFGGKAPIHPIVYLEALETFKARSKKMMSRIQKIYVSVDKSESGVATEQQLLATEFIEGSRIILKKPVYPKRSNRRCNALDNCGQWLNRVKTESREPLLTLEKCVECNVSSQTIDISVLSTFHRDRTSAIEIDPVIIKSACENLWSAVRDGKLNHRGRSVRFVTNRPLYPSRTVMYRYDGINIQQMPVSQFGTCRKTEVLVLAGSVYHHYITYWSGSETPEPDTAKDIHHYMFIDSSDLFEVKLDEVCGIMCYMIGDHIVLLLDQHKNSLDTIPTLVTQNDADLLTIELETEDSTLAAPILFSIIMASSADSSSLMLISSILSM
jgi:hypothetical protein